MLKSRYEERANNRIKSYLNSNYKFIDVKGGELLLNFRCHLNVYHFAKTKGYGIIGCYAWNDGRVSHFINKTKAGKYIDNTVGHTDFYTRYLLVNEYDVKDFEPRKDLQMLKNNIFMIGYTSSFLNWLFSFDADDLF